MRRVLMFFCAVTMAHSASAQTGTLIVLNKSDHTASLVDVATGAILATLPTGHGPHEVEVSPDGRRAVVANYGTGQRPGNSLSVLNIPARKNVMEIDLGEYTRPHGVAWLKENVVAVTVEGSRALILVDVENGKVLDAIPTDQNVSHMVALTPDGTLAFVANIGSGTTTVIDLTKREKLKDLETGAGTEGIAVSPDGKEVWVTNRSANTLSVIDVDKLQVTATLQSESFPIRVKLTPDGRHALVSNARSGDVAVFDVRGRKELRRIRMDLDPVSEADKRLFGNQFGRSPVPVGILIDPDGLRAYVANTQADIVTVINLKEWKVVDRLIAGREPDGLGFSKLTLHEE